MKPESIDTLRERERERERELYFSEIKIALFNIQKNINRKKIVLK